MRRFISVPFVVLFCCNLFSQAGNNVYLFTLEKNSRGELHLHSPRFLSSFNRGGYSNQPAFTPSGDLLLSVRETNDSQNDIWQFSLGTKKFRRLTNTSDFEYSPQIHPDEEHLTFLRKVDTNPPVQQVCKVHLRSGEMEVLTPDISDVGYYTWLSPDELGLFRIESNSNRLSYFNVRDNKSRKITTAVGRTLASDKKGALIYVHKFTDEYWYIKKYNPSTSAIDIISRTVGKTEDFALGPDGTYFMGQDHLLYAFTGKEKDWKQIADLSVYGIKFISRMAISPDGKKIVVIASDEKS